MASNLRAGAGSVARWATWHRTARAAAIVMVPVAATMATVATVERATTVAGTEAMVMARSHSPVNASIATRKAT